MVVNTFGFTDPSVFTNTEVNHIARRKQYKLNYWCREKLLPKDLKMQKQFGYCGYVRGFYMERCLFSLNYIQIKIVSV